MNVLRERGLDWQLSASVPAFAQVVSQAPASLFYLSQQIMVTGAANGAANGSANGSAKEQVSRDVDPSIFEFSPYLFCFVILLYVPVT